ncbi:hypothetical protein ABZ990_04375 [Streptomyces sp. NPDC046203]|uniref:hypothetical protein n=1 Tax=Streptomyces sp. NPDC046203 TaxID=3154602 RepID=UPI0033EF2770
MGKKLWRAVVAGGAAAVFTGLAAFPAGAAEGGAAFTRVKVNGGKPVVIGVANGVKVPTSFRLTTPYKVKWTDVFLYRGKTHNRLWHSIETSDCGVVLSPCDVTETMYFNPSLWDLRNSEAGAWKVAGEVRFKDGTGDIDDVGQTVYVKRNSRLSVKASPKPVAKGGTLTVTGKVTRANWETRKYVSYEGRKVSLQFKPAGATSYTSVKTVYANGKGDLKATVKASKTGTWRWMYGGNTTTGASTSAGDYVVVK